MQAEQNEHSLEDSIDLRVFGNGHQPVSVTGSNGNLRRLRTAIELHGLYIDPTARTTESDALHVSMIYHQIRARLPTLESHSNFFNLQGLSSDNRLALGIEPEDFEIDESQSIRHQGIPQFLFAELNLDYVLGVLRLSAKYLAENPANPRICWAVGILTIRNGLFTTQIFPSRPDVKYTKILWMAREVIDVSNGEYVEQWHGFRLSADWQDTSEDDGHSDFQTMASQTRFKIKLKLKRSAARVSTAWRDLTDDQILDGRVKYKDLDNEALRQLCEKRTHGQLLAVVNQLLQNEGRKTCQSSNLSHRVTSALKAHPKGYDHARAALDQARKDSGIKVGSRASGNVGGKLTKQIASLKRKGDHQAAATRQAQLDEWNATTRRSKKRSSRNIETGDDDDDEVSAAEAVSDSEPYRRKTRAQNATKQYTEQLEALEGSEKEDGPASKRWRIDEEDSDAYDDQVVQKDGDSDEEMEDA